MHIHERTMLRCLTAASLLAALLAGCTAPSKGTSQNTYTGGEGRETQAVIVNRELERVLQIANVRMQRGADGRLRAQFDLQSKRQTNLAFEWSVAWFDGAGFHIEFPEHWTPTTIGGGGFETLSIVAPTASAASWQLAFRTPNTVR
jgi:uncharacterized protein YcfL